MLHPPIPFCIATHRTVPARASTLFFIAAAAGTVPARASTLRRPNPHGGDGGRGGKLREGGGWAPKNDIFADCPSWAVQRRFRIPVLDAARHLVFVIEND